MKFPKFRYHPDPIKTGAIKLSSEVCESCSKATGYLYEGPVYSEHEVKCLCPWCIENGLAANKFKCIFIDGHPLLSAGISEEIVDEVCRRTPGYISWQQEVWQHHCQDACEYHGDAEKKDLLNLQGSDLENFLQNEMINNEYWKEIVSNYQKGGSPGIYKFKCRKCAALVFAMDFM